MAIVRILLVLALVVVSGRAQFDKELTEEEATAKWNCISHIVCDLEEGYVLERLIKVVEERLKNEGLQWITDAYGLPMPPSMEDDEITTFFLGYSDSVCIFSKEEREEAAKEFLIEFSKFSDEVCKNKFDAKECKGCNMALKEFDAIMAEYTERGECHNPEDTGKEMAESGKEKIPM